MCFDAYTYLIETCVFMALELMVIQHCVSHAKYIIGSATKNIDLMNMCCFECLQLPPANNIKSYMTWYNI